MMNTLTADSVADAGLSPLADDDLRLMLMIRHFERKLLSLFELGELNGTTHTSLGQEYIPVAMSALLDMRNFVFSNHRGHGHYLARHRDPCGLLAEIMGRDGAVCNGVGGSQHIFRDRYLSTGVQGESLPVATGVALALKRSEPGQLACAYIGDGTWGEGSVYEALNMAELWGAPLAIVVENNGIAQSTPTTKELAGTIAGRAKAFGVSHYRTESTDINRIRAHLAPLLDRVRSRGEPLVIEFATYRLGPHSKGDDSRSPEQLRRVAEHDWYTRYAAEYPAQFAAHDGEMHALIDETATEVAARPDSTWDNL